MGSSTPNLSDLLESEAVHRVTFGAATLIEKLMAQQPVISRGTVTTDEEGDPRPSPTSLTSRSNLAQAAYPHLFDESLPAGQALACLRQARGDAEAILDALGSDLESAQGALALVAAAAARASALADFDRGFSALVSFVRRATLVASAADIDRGAVNALVAALDLLVDHPIIGLAGAAEAAETLARHGWNGDSDVVNRLIAELLSSEDAETTPQVDLFAQQG